MVDRTLIRAPIVRIKVDAPFYTEAVEAKCMKNSLFDLVTGNVTGVIKPIDWSLEWGVVVSAVTRAQVPECGNSKPLNVKEITSKMALDKEELVKLQEDSTLQKFKEAKETEIRKGYRISYKTRGGIWYRARLRKEEVRDT